MKIKFYLSVEVDYKTKLRNFDKAFAIIGPKVIEHTQKMLGPDYKNIRVEGADKYERNFCLIR